VLFFEYYCLHGKLVFVSNFGCIDLSRHAKGLVCLLLRVVIREDTLSLACSLSNEYSLETVLYEGKVMGLFL